MAITQIGTGSQEYIIDKVKELLAAEPGGSKKVKATRNGICYMLSMEWVRKVILEGITPSLIDFNDQAEVDAKLELYRQIANNFYNYVQNILAQNDCIADVNQILEEAANHLLISNGEVNQLYAQLSSWNRMKAVTTYTAKSGYALVEKFNEVRPEYFLLCFIWEKSGHAMAGTLLGDGRVIFYDPNDGVYLVDSIEEVIAWVYAQYQDFGNPTDLDFCDIVPN